MNTRDIEIANYLADQGRSFSDVLYDDNHEYFERLSASYFAISAALALVWTGHARFENGFIEYAASYIDGSIPVDDSMASRYCKRFGPEELDTALIGYRSFYRRIRNLMPDFNTCSIQDINLLQTRLLNQLNNFRISREVVGIGPWLFLGPFKIILGDQQRLWANNGLDAIVLPTGLEVNRGIVRLQNEEYTFMNDFDVHWLEETTGSLLDNFAVCNMVHAHIVKIAELGGTTALHINSALYQYGRQDI